MFWREANVDKPLSMSFSQVWWLLLGHVWEVRALLTLHHQADLRGKETVGKEEEVVVALPLTSSFAPVYITLKSESL